MLVQLHKGGRDDGGHFRVHREVLVLPSHGVAHAAHLLSNGRARLLFPLPHLSYKVLAAEVVTGLAGGLQLALHHNLRSNSGVVCARYPQRVVALHAVVARKAVHDGLVKRVAHV